MSERKSAVDFTGSLMFIVSWLAGIVLANGALSTVIAICFPPYAWYLVMEKVMMMAGVA